MDNNDEKKSNNLSESFGTGIWSSIIFLITALIIMFLLSR